MATLRIAWHDYNRDETGFNIYRSDAPMNLDSMPSPIASVGPNVGAYDDNTVVGGQSYYYRIGVTRNGEELISEEQKLLAANFILVSGSGDNTVKKIDPDGNEIWTFTGHTDISRDVVVDSNDNVYSASFDNTVKKIDFSGNEVWTFDSNTNGNPDGHTDLVMGIAIDLSGNTYTASYDYAVKKIDSDGNHVWTFGSGNPDGHTDRLRAVAVDSNGNVYSGGDDEKVKKIDSNGNYIWTFNGNAGVVYKTAVDLAGNIYVGFSDNVVKKIDSNGNEITSGGWPFNVRTENDYPNYSQYSNVYGLAVDSGGNVYTGSRDSTVKKIDSSGNEIWAFTEHQRQIRSVDVDSDGNVYSASDDDTVKKIDPNGNEVWTFSGHTSNVYSVAVYLDY